MKTKSKHGGKRKGAGRKAADYETKTVSFRVKVEMEQELRRLVSTWLERQHE